MKIWRKNQEEIKFSDLTGVKKITTESLTAEICGCIQSDDVFSIKVLGDRAGKRIYADCV